MKNLIPFEQRQKALFGLVLITTLTYILMILNVLYNIGLSIKLIVAPVSAYILFCFIVYMYYRLINWWEMLTIWFDRKSEDERSDD